MRQPKDLHRLFKAALRENAAPLVIVALHLVFALSLAWRFRFDLRVDPWFSLSAFAAWCTAFFATPLLWLLLTKRPERPIRFVGELATSWRIKERVFLALPILPAVAILLPTYSSVKSAIPAITAYDLDPLFSRMDVWIHGRHAWEVLQPVLGYPVVTYAINAIYNLWVVFFYVVFCAVAIWVEQPALRRRFLIAFALCWILLGNVAAILLPSVGPCFYGLFYADDPYVGLMQYLRGVDQVLPLAALDVQEMLITWWRRGDPGLARGISAMPSMHVSIACLMMLLSWRLGRGWAVAGTLFLVCIFLGSIHLGYHYAVDGYASLIVTPLIWGLARPLAAIGIDAPAQKLAAQAAE